MNSPAESQLEALCPYCRGVIRLPAEDTAGSVRCPRCNENVPQVLLEARVSSSRQVVSQSNTASSSGKAPPRGENAAESRSAKQPQPPEPVKEVRVICKLCGTIVYQPIEKVGEQVQCPDCESMNTIPAPPKPKKKVEVKLEQNETFHLSESLDQPDKHSASSQQKWYMAKCPTCFTQLRLTVDQAGQQIKCPDCYTSFTAAQPPPEPQQSTSVLLDDPYELKLSDPVERPPVDVDDLISSKQVPLPNELRAASQRGELDSREKLESMHSLVKGGPQENSGEDLPEPEPSVHEPRPSQQSATSEDFADEPIASIDSLPEEPEPQSPGREENPDEPVESKPADSAKKRSKFKLSAQSMFLKKLLLADLRPFSSDSGLIIRWVVLVLLVGATLWLGASTLHLLQQELDPVNSAFMLGQSILSGLMILLTLIAIANTLLPIIISAGLEQEIVEDWPPFSPAEWFFQGFYIVNALAIGALPTVILAPFSNMPVMAFFQWLLIVPLFPVAILSMLDEGSPFAPYSPSLWRLISVYKGLWLRFTGISYALSAAGMIMAGLTMYTASMIMAALAGLVIASLIVVYARFIGRMAMFMSEQSGPQESLEEYD